MLCHKRMKKKETRSMKMTTSFIQMSFISTCWHLTKNEKSVVISERTADTYKKRNGSGHRCIRRRAAGDHHHRFH